MFAPKNYGFSDDIIKTASLILEKKQKDDPCWKGYEMIGTKKKSGKEVPNCVKTESAIEADDNGDGIKDKVKLMKNKTKVSLDPNTDDNIDNNETENKDSDKARKNASTDSKKIKTLKVSEDFSEEEIFNIEKIATKFK